MNTLPVASRALMPFALLALGMGLSACSENANSGGASTAPNAERQPASTGGIDVTVVGSFTDQAEDANGQREDGCSLNFIVNNRSDLNLKSFQGSFDVFKHSTGAKLNKHFPLVLSDLAAGSSQTSPPDTIHSARCEDVRVVITRSTCRQDAKVACPPLRYTAQGLATVEVTSSP